MGSSVRLVAGIYNVVETDANYAGEGPPSVTEEDAAYLVSQKLAEPYNPKKPGRNKRIRRAPGAKSVPKD